MQINNFYKYSLIFLSFNLNGFFYEPVKKPFIIMLDPAGDAKNAGRVLNDCFERGITLQFAHELKKLLEYDNQNIKIILTRIPGETLEPLQNANFSNRLNVNLYLSIHFYNEKKPMSQVYLYNYISDPIYIPIIKQLHFYTFDNAFLFNIKKTIEYANKFISVFQDKNRKINFAGFFSIPFKPLIGIKSPALALEIGVKNSSEWQNFLHQTKEAINLIIQQEMT